MSARKRETHRKAFSLRDPRFTNARPEQTVVTGANHPREIEAIHKGRKILVMGANAP